MTENSWTDISKAKISILNKILTKKFSVISEPGRLIKSAWLSKIIKSSIIVRIAESWERSRFPSRTSKLRATKKRSRRLRYVLSSPFSHFHRFLYQILLEKFTHYVPVLRLYTDIAGKKGFEPLSETIFDFTKFKTVALYSVSAKCRKPSKNNSSGEYPRLQKQEQSGLQVSCKRLGGMEKLGNRVIGEETSCS